MMWAYLGAAALCTFAGLIEFKGSYLDALNIGLAVLNFGMFLTYLRG